MKSWMCVVGPRNWDVMKQEKLFGVNPHGRKKLAKVRLKDFLAIFVKDSVNGVVAICEVASEMFMGDSDIWTGNYPYQIRFRFLPQFKLREENPVALHTFLGRINRREGFTVEPLLINMSLVRLSEDHFMKLRERFLQ